MRDLCPHLGDIIERVTAADRLDAANGPLHKALVDGFLHQRAAWAGADFALVKRKQRKPFQGFIKEGILFLHHVREEDVRGFPAQLEGHRNDVLRGVLHDLLAHLRRPGKRHFGNPL